MLLSTLKRISNAYAVAFDLELSGIPARKQGRDRRTLEDRYAETKEAAEKYHILQLGLTLIEEDTQKEHYVLRSYNIPLSPLCDEYWGLDRNFTYSSGAVGFLLKNGYQMDSPFGFGIPYLTKAEEPIARENYLKRFDRMAIPDVMLRNDEVENFALIQRVKDEVQAWLDTKKVRILRGQPIGRRFVPSGLLYFGPDSARHNSASTEIVDSRSANRMLHRKMTESMSSQAHQQVPKPRMVSQKSASTSDHSRGVSCIRQSETHSLSCERSTTTASSQ